MYDVDKIALIPLISVEHKKMNAREASIVIKRASIFSNVSVSYREKHTLFICINCKNYFDFSYYDNLKIS